MTRFMAVSIVLVCSIGCSDSDEVKQLRDEVKSLKDEVASLKQNKEVPVDDLETTNKVERAKDDVGVEIELDRVKQQLGNFRAHILKAKHEIARQEVEKELATEKVAGLRNQIAKSSNDINKLRDDLAKGGETFEYAGRKFTANQVTRDLEARFNSHKALELSLEELKKDLESRTSLLEKAYDDLRAIEATVETLQLKFEKLRARLEGTEADQNPQDIKDTDISLDEDKLKAIQEKLDDVKASVETKDRFLDVN